MSVARKLSNTRRIHRNFNGRAAPPITLNINLTSLCNSRCVFCELKEKANIRRDEELSTGELLDIIDQAAEMGVREIGIGGGEPLLRGDAEEIISFAREKNLDVGLASNGMIFSLLSDEDLLMLKENVSFIPVSIDSVDPEENDRIRGVEGAFEKTINGFKRLKELNFNNLGINSVIMKSNFMMIPDLLKLAIELEARVLTFQPVNHESNYPFINSLDGKEDFLLGEEDLEGLQSAIDEGLKILKKQRKLTSNLNSFKIWAAEYFKYCNSDDYFFRHVEELNYFRCYVPFAFLNLDWQGRVIPCFIMESDMHVRDLSLQEIWYKGLHEFREHLREGKYYDACRRCFCSFPFNLENSVLFSPFKNSRLFKRLYLDNLRYYL